jgi:hypothetical protein
VAQRVPLSREDVAKKKFNVNAKPTQKNSDGTALNSPKPSP